MFCKNCGSAMEDGAKFCASCGTAQEAQPIPEVAVTPAETPVEVPAETPVEVETQHKEPKVNPFNTLKEKAAPLLDKVKPIVQKYKLALVGILALVMFVSAICIIIGLCTAGNGYIPYENATMINIVDNEVVAVWNNKVIKTGIEAESIERSSTNLDGTVFVALTDDGTLFFVRNKKAKVIAEDVTGFILSNSGTAVAYVATNDDDGHSLNLYNISKKKNVVVDDEYSALAGAFLGMALSPDGKTLAYYEFDEEEYESTLMLFKGKKSVKITSSEVELIGLSNGGKYIYVIGENDNGEKVLYTYNKKGDRTKLNNCSGSSFYFNEDHTQILFVNDGKSYISTKGKDANKIGSGVARLVLASNSVSFSAGNYTTYPVDNLYGHVYRLSTDDGYNLWNIKKNSDNSKQLVKNVTNWKLDADAKYVYYVNDNDDLCVLKISHGDNASAKAKTIAEDVTNYVVTSNRKRVYFISDGGLYSCNAKNGNGKKTIASEDISGQLAINAKDVVYYSMDGDTYACSNGRKGKKVLSDSTGFVSSPNGIVYAGTEDALYVSTGAKKLKKLLNLD